MNKSSTLFAAKEVSESSPSLSYQGRLAFWFAYFLRRNARIEKEVGIIKPYRPKVSGKSQLLLTGPAPLPTPPAQIVIS